MAEFTNFDKRMFERARQVAETSDFNHFHLGCVIAYKHHIIAEATNSNKTHPTQRKYNLGYRHFRHTGKPCPHTIHAEIAALNKISYPIAQQIDWSKVQVYIYRICPGKPKNMGLARCCPACMQALRDKGIQHIYYTGDNSYIYEKLV